MACQANDYGIKWSFLAFCMKKGVPISYSSVYIDNLLISIKTLICFSVGDTNECNCLRGKRTYMSGPDIIDSTLLDHESG